MCDYCEGRKYLLNQYVSENDSEKLKLVVSTHGKTLGILATGAELNVYIDLKTNYCPMCGKDLKE